MVKRFGIFEFDCAARELRREGVPVRLQGQPAQVLGALLANAGDVVSRESLQKTVWGDATHGDFESGLNFCIAQVRSALGDSTESPRFIRTVPKRGYQFIAPVSGPVAPVTAPAPPDRRWMLWAAAAVLPVAAVSGWYAWPRMRQPIRIAVARFENQTGNPDLDLFTDGLADAVVADLTALGRFDVIGNAAILRLSRIQQDIGKTGADLRANYIVIGQVQGDASKARALVHLIRVADQAHLKVTRVDTLNLADPLRAQSDVAKRAAEEFLRKLPTS